VADNLSERIDYYEISRIRKSSLNGVRRTLKRRLDRALDRFYAKVATVPALGHFFSGKAQMDRAKSAQAKHWMGVFTDGVDEAYQKRSEFIGQTHARIGLEPKWYIGGYTLILEEMIHGIIAPGPLAFVPGRKAMADQVVALMKVALLDIDIALTGYFINSEEKMRTIVSDKLGTALAAVARGDLTISVNDMPPEYVKVQTDFNSAVEALRIALGTVVNGVDVISTGADEIRAASNDLAQRTEQQAASLEETSASMNQVTSIVQETAQNAGSANIAIGSAFSAATEGGLVVQRAVEAMGHIEKSSDQINQIISVIDGIAFQTNLLALNAGVEAARAGEAGKGFAVVASEVRALALRSAEAAKDIKDLITASASQVTKGVDLVGETGDVLGNIVERISELRTSIEGIAHSAEIQASNLSQINAAVSDMDRMTQQNAAMVEQSTAAARSLADQARGLEGAVRGFTIGYESGQSGQMRRAA